MAIFLGRLVSNTVTATVFDHVEQRSQSTDQLEAMLSGIEISCRDKAVRLVERYKQDGRFENVDWFGRAGTALGADLSNEMLSELGVAP